MNNNSDESHFSINPDVNDCLDRLLYEDVAAVVYAFTNAYFWIRDQYPDNEKQSVIDIFLNTCSTMLCENLYPRQVLGEYRPGKRNAEKIFEEIKKCMKGKSRDESISFLGELVGAYALSVPEPLFRAEPMFWGLHQTADVPPQNDDLPMTDGMILFGWQYHWFYSWLGY